MRWHKLKADGPIAITITDARLQKGTFGPEFVVKGQDGRGDVGVSLSPLGALKQFFKVGVGQPSADALPQDVDLPEYHGTFRIEMEQGKDGKYYTRVQKIADDDFERLLDDGEALPQPQRPAPMPIAQAQRTQRSMGAPETATDRYTRLLPAALGFAAQIAESGYASPDANSIVATLMIDEQKRGF
jgi:hypothetical protein